MSIKGKTIINKIKRNNPYFEDLITRSVYHSNKIEGSTLSYAETYSIIFDNKNKIQVKADPREVFEAVNLKYAMNYTMNNADANISISFIEKIATFINKNIKDINKIRKTQVFITGAEHIPPKPEEVPMLLSKLIYKDTKDREEDIFDYIARFHIEFEHIHPFEDGNGRTGRVLITKELLNRGLAPVVIPVEKRKDYMEYLAKKDIKKLSQMLKKLNEEEIERMKKFGIKLTKKGK